MCVACDCAPHIITLTTQQHVTLSFIVAKMKEATDDVTDQSS